MRTEVDLTRLTPRQREVLTALALRLSKNEVERLPHLVEATTHSGGVIRDAVKQAVDRAKAAIEELVLRDNQGEKGATIRMRMAPGLADGGRA